ncbi:MAG: NfeD family protein [Planctomycetota bacterium]
MEPQDGSGNLVASILLGAGAFGIFFIEFVVPSGGLLAILCVLCAIGSVVFGFMYDATLGMALLAGYSIAAPFMVVLGLRLAAKTPIGKRMILSAEDPARAGAGIAESRPDLPAVGTRGEAITPLRPSGFARFGGRRIDASAEGDLIDAGTAVEIVSVRDGQIRVRPVAAE